MRIFFVCRRVPFPPDRGDKIATFNEIRHLSARHEVHVFCLGDGSEDLENIPGLRKYATSVTAAPINALTIKLRALKALLSGEPLSVAAFNEAKLHTAIRRKFDELRPDLIIVYSCNMAQFAEHFRDVPRIMHFGDLDSLKWRQFQIPGDACELQANPLRKRRAGRDHYIQPPRPAQRRQRGAGEGFVGGVAGQYSRPDQVESLKSAQWL